MSQTDSDDHTRFNASQLALLTLGLGLGTFMEVLDTSIANVAVPTIAGSLGVSANQGTWVISSYSVAAAIAVPLTGWLARQVGEHRLFIGSLIAFTVCSILCGLAPNMTMLVLFRLLQGLVSGPMVPLSQTILLRHFPIQKRGLAMALWAMTVVVAPILGPLLGGWITENYHWSWIFFINMPVGIASALIVRGLLKGRETAIQRLPFDRIGLALLVIGIGSLQMLLDLGNDRDWFSSPFILTLGIVAVICLVWLVIWEWGEVHPVVDLTLFKKRNFAFGVLMLGVGYMTFFSTVVIFPLWLQQVMGYTSGLAGLATAPTGLLALVCSPIVGKNLNRWDARAVVSLGFIIFAIVTFWSATFTLDTTFGQVIQPRLLQGIGIACFFVPINTIMLSGVEEHRLASASGLSNFVRTLSGAIGTSISVTLWDHRAIFHHARLGESIVNGTAATQDYLEKLASLGIDGGQAHAQLDRILTGQAYMMAANDFYHLCGAVFVLLIGLVWLTKPQRGATAALGH
ncbi:DHA2 family efflux MFS transporter permease subunit [Paludibacterium purpuratum]|uniref:DHA2 family multidrug resistance protein n=1 Tax=Paludibacterium purpuratum TaxID=1144873 RepID=A0A4R7BET3_9NEIS|nr:DHA2 family efflux MFS transporter permease subunit [Paludibacterium purpuratum]TDR82266.1 DHA2 family multidrug resistance protein [Paludibacterium purpuratum]